MPFPPSHRHRIDRDQRRANGIQYFSFASVVACLVFGPSAAAAQASQVKILAINAKNGRPVKHVDLLVSFTESQTKTSLLETDRTGAAMISADQNGSILVKSSGLHTDCRATPGSETHFPVSTILSEGITVANSCGNASRKANPGELVLFVRKTTFWERD
jgi:outer membrane protein assembly factor BamB